MVQITSQALGSDPATGGKGAEQAVEKASNVATDERKVGGQDKVRVQGAVTNSDG